MAKMTEQQADTLIEKHPIFKKYQDEGDIDGMVEFAKSFYQDHGITLAGVKPTAQEIPEGETTEPSFLTKLGAGTAKALQYHPGVALSRAVSKDPTQAAKVAGAMGISAAGTLGGAALGALTSPVTGPAGPVVGAMAGSAGAEALSQKLGLVPESKAMIGIAGALPGVVAAPVAAVRSLVRPVYDLFRGSKGIENILYRSYEKIIGSSRMKEVANVLEKYISPLAGKGYKPTAAEALAKTPAGSPVQALEKITARTTGGPSTKFGERILQNKKVLEDAAALRENVTGPMRKQVLRLVDKVGGVPTPTILGRIYDLGRRPDLVTNKVVQKTLNDVRQQIIGATKKLKMNGESLYTIRKLVGNTIAAHSKEAATWDKRLASSLEKDVQKIIDNAIDKAVIKAGGTGIEWTQYLVDYARRSKEISDTVATKVASLKPTQVTQLMGAHDLTSVDLPKVAILSRPVVIANAILSYLGKKTIEPLVDELSTRLLLDPVKLGRFLRLRPEPVISGPIKAGAVGASLLAGQEAATMQEPLE